MISKIQEKDRNAFHQMVGEFYSSDAVLADVSEKNIDATFDEAVSNSPYLDAYILMNKASEIAGYAIIVRTFSPEAGGKVIWLEELFIKLPDRSQGLASEFLDFMKKNLTGDVKRIRLEVERDNEGALAFYKRNGFKNLPYLQLMISL